jgi:hypothetical protein
MRRSLGLNAQDTVDREAWQEVPPQRAPQLLCKVVARQPHARGPSTLKRTPTATLQAAFEHCVRCYVARLECAALGPTSVDAAAAAHNLGCVLDRLGKRDRALQLLEGAAARLAEALGREHPRAAAAARNAARARAVSGAVAAAAAEKLQRGGDNSSGGVSGRDAPRDAATRLLAAASVRRGREAGRGGGAQGPRPRLLDYTDPEYLGGGLFQVR